VLSHAPFQDAIEEAEVAALLRGLPESHAGRVAFTRGVDTIGISKLVDCSDLARHLRLAYTDGCARRLRSLGRL
jgi:hypothetical protein